MMHTTMYERDPTLSHRWLEKVPIEELDYWNQSAERYFAPADDDELASLED